MMVHWWVLVHCGYEIGLEAWSRSGSGYSKRPSLFSGSDLVWRLVLDLINFFSKEGSNKHVQFTTLN
jgi:hypothetical protein